jgi:hypothetical protein
MENTKTTCPVPLSDSLSTEVKFEEKIHFLETLKTPRFEKCMANGLDKL